MSASRGRARLRATALALALVLPSSVALAQADSTHTPCDGLVISRVEIDPSPPPFSGYAARWRAAAHTIGLHHATTRAHVVEAFLSLRAGMTCTEFRRAETERVLRAQPFLSNAAVTTQPDGTGGAVLLVRTVDEIPVLISGSFRGIAPTRIGLGTENLAGEALHVAARFERARGYRTGYGGHLEQNALFGKPYRAAIDADRFRIGHQVLAEIEHPIFTDLQRISWHAGVTTRDEYLSFERPARDRLNLRVTNKSWDGSALLRLFGTGTVTLLGAAATGRRMDPAARGIVVEDSGFVADTGHVLDNRYQPFRASRIGVTGGLRRMRYRSVRGFDALTAEQDVASGAMLGVFAARGLPRFGEGDTFLSSALYAGHATARSLIATVAQVEGRRDPIANEWNSIIGSARTALYLGSAPGVVFMASDEWTGGTRSRLPLQLAFNDREGGLLGYRNSSLAGGHRNVAHAELRVSGASLVRRADVGLAVFSEVGTLWAADVPYGVNTTQGSAGISILAAYPTRAKRLYRVDIAMPFTRANGAALEIRFSGEDRTQGFWREPRDLTQARTGIEPARLFAWPNR